MQKAESSDEEVVKSKPQKRAKKAKVAKNKRTRLTEEGFFQDLL